MMNRTRSRWYWPFQVFNWAWNLFCIFGLIALLIWKPPYWFHLIQAVTVANCLPRMIYGGCPLMYIKWRLRGNNCDLYEQKNSRIYRVLKRKYGVTVALAAGLAIGVVIFVGTFFIMAALLSPTLGTPAQD